MPRQIRSVLLRSHGERGRPALAATKISAASLPLGPEGVSDAILRARLDDLYRAHARWLREAMGRRFGADRAEDLTQETFVRAAGYLEHEIAVPRALLITIAKNVARDHLRRARVRTDHVERTLQEERYRAYVEARALDDDLQVREVIKSLPPKFRDVLLLSKIGGLTNREIAQRYRVSVRAIDKRMQKAIALFVARLRD